MLFLHAPTEDEKAQQLVSRLARDNGAENAARVLRQAERIAEAHGSDTITEGMVATAVRWVMGRIFKQGE